MRTATVRDFGAPEELQATESPEPTVGPDEVRVAGAYIDTLFVETQIRRGLAPWFPQPPPYVPGGGVSGTVVEVGAGADAALVGRRVAALTGFTGGYAEQVVVAADDLLPVPDTVALAHAAALLHDGPTALGLLSWTDIVPGEWVLITAAAGGLGTLLVQLVRERGGRVIAAAGGPRKAELVAGLGADLLIDYTVAGWEQQVRDVTDGRGVDVVLDGAGGALGARALSVTARGGRFSAHGAPSGDATVVDDAEGIEVRGIDQVQFDPPRRRELAGEAIAVAATSNVRPIIGQLYPLTEAAAAHTAMETRQTLGKTLLTTERHGAEQQSAIFTDAELAYLARQPVGRLATVAPDGTVQNSPVSFHVDPDRGTVEIGGNVMASTKKYRNVLQGSDRVALVVDDIVDLDHHQVRGIEIRGRATAVRGQVPYLPGLSDALIRIHPELVLSWSLNPATSGITRRQRR